MITWGLGQFFLGESFFVPAGLMTPFNVSVVLIYSFSTNWIDCCRNCTETSQNISDFCFPRTRLPVALSQLTAISWHLFQLQLPSCEVHCWEEKGKGSSSISKSTASWNDCGLFSALILICKSRCITVCINWFLACLSWKNLQVLEYAKNTDFLFSFASSSGVFFFPPDLYILVMLWPVMPRAGCSQHIKSWSWTGMIPFFGGENILEHHWC